MDQSQQSRRTWRSVRSALELTSTVAIIFACSAVIWVVVSGPRYDTSGQVAQAPRTLSKGRLPDGPLSLEAVATVGSMKARLAVVEYSDFQCPYCAQFQRTTLPALVNRYIDTGKVVFAFRHYPLERMHPLAHKAAEAAECARRQGRFWQMHDLLFDASLNLTPPNLLSRAQKLALDQGQFAQCLEGQAAEAVAADARSLRGATVSGTPVFFVGRLEPDHTVTVREKLAGAQPIAKFVEIIEKLLNEPPVPR